jgi:hypothetical protein
MHESPALFDGVQTGAAVADGACAITLFLRKTTA